MAKTQAIFSEEKIVRVWKTGEMGGERWGYYVQEEKSPILSFEAIRAKTLEEELPKHYCLFSSCFSLHYLISIKDIKKADTILRDCVKGKIEIIVQKYKNKGEKYKIIDVDNVISS